MRPGYYTVGDEVYRITGTSKGNAYYNLYADEPRWAEIAISFLPKETYFSCATYSVDNPVRNK